MPRAAVVNYSSLLPHRRDIHSNLPSQFIVLMRPLVGAFHTSIGREFRITSWLPQRRPKEKVKFNGCLTWIELNVELRASSHSTSLSWLRLLF